MNGENMSSPIAGFSTPKNKTLPSPWVWFAFTVFFGALTAFLVYAQTRAPAQPVKTATPQVQQVLPLRNTFSGQTDDLIKRYNLTASKIDQKLALPSADLLQKGAKNAAFHGLQHKVTPNITVHFEIDNVSKKPFSIGVIGAPSSNAEIGSMVAVIATLGVTVFGKGEDDGVLARTCASAAQSKEQTLQIRRDGFDVFCTSVMGGWIAGISVPAKL